MRATRIVHGSGATVYVSRASLISLANLKVQVVKGFSDSWTGFTHASSSPATANTPTPPSQREPQPRQPTHRSTKRTHAQTKWTKP